MADPQWILDVAEKNKRLGRIAGLRAAARNLRKDAAGRKAARPAMTWTVEQHVLLAAARWCEREARKLEKAARRG